MDGAAERATRPTYRPGGLLGTIAPSEAAGWFGAMGLNQFHPYPLTRLENAPPASF